jgi:hypothetical protein
MLRNHIAAFTLALTLPLVLMGCGESENPIQQYGEEVIQAGKRTRRVRARADMQAMKTAIQQFYIERGHFPDGLEELSIVRYQGIDPDLYVYDPATGEVQLR